MSEVILRAENVSMDFSGVRVLFNVDVEFERGVIYGIVGENGAGKSTLMKIISGFLQPTEGSVYVDGKRVSLNPLKAKELGIILIPQELNLVDSLRVYENIFLGDEITRGMFLKKSEMVEKSEELMRRFNLDISPTQLVSTLSPAQKQLIEILKAVSKRVRLLIMDEPTSTLSEREVKRLFELIRGMKREGITVVFISHRLKEVKEIADRIVVLRDGRKVFQGRAEDLTESEIAELMIGRELSEMYPEKPEPSKETILSVRNLSSACGRVRKVSFDLKRGEILGFYGLVGAGRTELMETILGIRKKVEGEIFLRGERVEISSPDEARRLGIVYLPEDRKSAGIIGILEAYKNVTLMNLKKYSRFLLRKRLEFEAFELYRKRFSIRARGPRQLVRTLSGGNQQKVVISKLVDTGSKIFIFDEPTRGVDVNAKHQIYEIMRRLVDELGATFVVVSSELPEIIGISNRVVVMRNGRIVAQVEGEELNERDLIYYATGVREGSGV